MQCYTELVPPSGVTHALSIPFCSPSEINLVVVKTSLLQIFSVISGSSSKTSEAANEGANALQRSDQAKLLLLSEYNLSGTVTAISRVKIISSKSGGDAILLSFRNAKLSLIDWDPGRQCIATISIHYYEKDDLTRSPWAPDLSACGSHLTVDPSSRCAILNFGIHNLAILPFHQAGDDLVMDDYDPELDGHLSKDEHDQHMDTNKDEKSDLKTHRTPYGASFVLPLTALDPALLHPISLEFLHEYREPTFGILYSQIATSSSLFHERKDVVYYSVFTLDLEQRASTTLLSVPRLPSDLFKVVALSPPVGGALLIGANVLIHIDQSGKTNAVGVNEFSRQVSSFSMADQSDLALRLENCVVQSVPDETGDVLLLLSNGDMAMVNFKRDGRSVSGISVRLVAKSTTGNVMRATASCSTALSSNRFFFGSEDTDSVLVESLTAAHALKKTKNSTGRDANNLNGDMDMEEEEDDVDPYEDDLYSTVHRPPMSETRASTDHSTSDKYAFRILDSLISISPLRDISLGKAVAKGGVDSAHLNSPDATDLELLASHGSGKGGGLVSFQRKLDVAIRNTLEEDNAEAVWSVEVSRRVPHLSTTRNDSPKDVNDGYMIISRFSSPDKEQSVVYSPNGAGFEVVKAPDFNPNQDCTIDIAVMSGRTRIVQVLRGEVRIYDSGLELAQIYPIWDEDVSDERIATSASFGDPYLVILRDDASLLLLRTDESGDLDEVVLNHELRSLDWLSVCLYTDKTDTFGSQGMVRDSPGVVTYLFGLTKDCRLLIVRLPDLELVSMMEGVDCLLPYLSTDPPPRRPGTRETLTEILVADLGDSSFTSPHLLLRTATDDLVIYRPFLAEGSESAPPKLKFFKEVNHHLPKVPAEASHSAGKADQRRARPLRVLSNSRGISAVFMPGASPSFVLRTMKSLPHIVELRVDFVRGLTEFQSSDINTNFAYIDSYGILQICSISLETCFDLPWPLRRISLGEQVDQMAYATVSKTYVLGTSQKADFKLPEDDELHTEWRNEVITFVPQTDHGCIRLLSPKSWSIIDSYPLSEGECITALENINLEVSEASHERKDMIVVATTFAAGEDIAARGCIYVFDVIEVVPDPEEPENNLKLKLVGKELLKGAVTALSGIGGQGFLIVAQGQKCMVRGLKDDGSILPVAFIDVQCYVSVIKELRATGMCLIGDALKGLWFVGYSEEPYKMTLFGKDMGEVNVVAADFLPDGKRLYMLVADEDSNLHVLQYDPEDPNSSNGDRLLSRSRFHMGHFASTIKLLPRTAVSSEMAMANSDNMDIDGYSPLYQALITTQTGAVSLVTSLSEESYRRLSALQSQLANTLEHPCGLNPRAYRLVESDGIGGRGMIDGRLLHRWLDLGRQRRMEIANRVGSDEWEIRADLEIIAGGGLGYI